MKPVTCNPVSCNSESFDTKATVILVLGMAGSGKTTFIQRLEAHLRKEEKNTYLINLDPAVLSLPYNAHIDIRDTVNYKKVMQNYGLGPNGGILTSMNLMATKFEQVLSLCEKSRDPRPHYIIVDTPGQLEIFTWSASGSIISEAFASSFPTIVTYILDTTRCQNPLTFTSNMLQACSILYKTCLPLILVFNKTDVVRHDFAIEWMQDFEKLHSALAAEETFLASLSRSLSLVLDELYHNLPCVGVSALMGHNINGFFDSVAVGLKDYMDNYLPDLEARKDRQKGTEKSRVQREVSDLRKVLTNTSSQAR